MVVRRECVIMAAMKRKPIAFKPAGADYEIRVVGDRATPLRDFYHGLLQLPWWATIAAISTAFLVTNALFAVGFVAVGGVNHATPSSFRDAFFFSVQTMGTIGYGAMFPESTAANVLVVARVDRQPAADGGVDRAGVREVLALDGAVRVHAPRGGLAGERRADADVPPRQRARQPDRQRADPAGLVRTERTSEGGTFYRMLDLKPTRERALSLSRSWNVLHEIDAQSPLAGETPASVIEKEVELQVMVIGTDDISMQTVHAAYRYFAKDIVWGARMADVLTETPDGHLQLDLGRFHEVEPTAPAPGFPYPS